MNPEKSKLRIEPVKREEKKTFCECAHVLGVLLLASKIVKPRPFGTTKPPNPWARRFCRPYGKKRDSLSASRSKVSIAVFFRRMAVLAKISKVGRFPETSHLRYLLRFDMERNIE